MEHQSFHAWRIAAEIQRWQAIRPTPLGSLSPLLPLFFYCQSLQPTPPTRFTLQTTRFALSTIPCKNRPGSVATGPSAATYFLAPEPPEPSAAQDLVHVEDPDPDVESPGGSSAGVDGRREDVGDEGACRSGGGGGEGSDRRRTLPKELLRKVMVLACKSSAKGGSCVVYLVGTNHMSEESCREVEAVISYLKPQVVFLELCPDRVSVFKQQERHPKVPTFGEMVGMYKKKRNPINILHYWYIAKVINKLGIYHGAEFRVAYEEAMKYGGKVILGDRPIQVTCQRMWAKMPLWQKTKLIVFLLLRAVLLPSPEDLNKKVLRDDVDSTDLKTQKMSKIFPTLAETLVHERDQYMSYTLLKVAREHSSVVAVVGRGHLSGIRKNWKQPVAVKDLLEVPPEKPAVSAIKMLSSLGAAVAGAAILSAAYFGWKKRNLKLLH